MGRGVVIHTPVEIEAIRKAAAATAFVRDEVARQCRAGMSTKELDMLAGAVIAQTGGTSAFLGYYDYPGQICISVNEEVVHGIGRPDRILLDSDIVSIDVGVKLGGGIGDTALTFTLGGEVSSDVKRLLEGTKLALEKGIAAALPGNTVRDISRAVESVAKEYKLGVVRDYVGHGCGTKLHELPEVPNFVGHSAGPKLVPGMVLAIEPMLTLGTWRVNTDRHDHWTVRTQDGKWAAHFEHLVLITENKPEILTWQKMM